MATNLVFDKSKAVTDSLHATFSLYTGYDQYGCVYPFIFGTPSYYDLYRVTRQDKFRSCDDDLVRLVCVI